MTTQKPRVGNTKSIVLKKLLTHPVTFFPLMVGGAGLMCSVVLGLGGVAIFGSIVALLGGIGGFFTNLLFRGKAINQSIIDKFEREAREVREQRLSTLKQHLDQDNDDRTTRAFKNLRELTAAAKVVLENGRLNEVSAFEIATTVDKLFEICVDRLERSYALFLTAQSAPKPAKKGILVERDKIIEEVQASIEELRETVVHVQTVGISSTTGAEDEELARLRKNLSLNRQVAEEVEQRSSSLEAKRQRMRDVGRAQQEEKE